MCKCDVSFSFSPTRFEFIHVYSCMCCICSASNEKKGEYESSCSFMVWDIIRITTKDQKLYNQKKNHSLCDFYVWVHSYLLLGISIFFPSVSFVSYRLISHRIVPLQARIVCAHVLSRLFFWFISYSCMLYVAHSTYRKCTFVIMRSSKRLCICYYIVVETVIERK